VAPMLSFTMHGRARPIIGNGCRGGGHVAPDIARGPYASLGRDENMPTESGAPMLTLQGSGEEEIIPDGVQGSGALMTS
jgi:hypothetical protein